MVSLQEKKSKETPKQEPEVVEKKGKKQKWTTEEWAAWEAEAKMQKQEKKSNQRHIMQSVNMSNKRKN